VHFNYITLHVLSSFYCTYILRYALSFELCSNMNIPCVKLWCALSNKGILLITSNIYY